MCSYYAGRNKAPSGKNPQDPDVDNIYARQIIVFLLLCGRSGGLSRVVNMMPLAIPISHPEDDDDDANADIYIIYTYI